MSPNTKSYDAIIIGARVAGAPTAMLLARKGYRVLLVDKASFPSDTLSTHQVQLPGIAHLKQWGLLDRVVASNAPATARVKFDTGYVSFEGVYPQFEGLNAMFSPRRIILDKILVDAAVEAGAELREDFIVDQVLMDGERVTGIRGHSKDNRTMTETAQIVIGADGKHSLVAKAVQAPVYHEKPVLSFGYYTYFEGITRDRGEMYGRPDRLVGAWPTNDGQTMIYVSGPVSEFQSFRSDVEGNYLKSVDLVPELAERVHASQRTERIFGMADMPNFYRKPYGPGWALVGDAGYVKDAITGQGISDAFRDAELLVAALDVGFSERQALDSVLAEYEQKRNAASQPMYEFTAQLAAFKPAAVEERTLFESLPGKPDAISQFFGMLTGAVPVQEFFQPRNLFKIIGLRGMSKIMLSKVFVQKPKSVQNATSVAA